jgi:hypothetical protein
MIFLFIRKSSSLIAAFRRFLKKQISHQTNAYTPMPPSKCPVLMSVPVQVLVPRHAAVPDVRPDVSP